MSQELHALLTKRAQIRVLKWPAGLAVSFGLHLAIISGVLLWPNSIPKVPQEKIRWITLPAASGGVSGGSTPTEAGQTRGRQRRVEEVAPVRPTPPPPRPTPAPVVTPTPVPAETTPPPRQEPRVTPRQTETRPPAQTTTARPPSGTNPDSASRGTATTAAKAESPASTVVPGTAGSGSSGGIGHGSGIPGLRPTQGIMGGTGILQEFIGAGDFPLWYAQQIQDSVTRNWIQLRGTEGRVQIYFRIVRTGKIEGARVEISSGKSDLDEMALQAVRRTNLPQLPDDFEGDSLGVRFWFNYGT